MYSYHVPVAEGKTYNITAKVKAEGDNITFGMTRNEKDVKKEETYPGYAAEYSVNGTGGEWVDVSYNFTAASGTVSAGVKMLFNAGVGDVYIDKIQLREITTVGDEPPHNVWRLYGWGTGVNDCGVEGSTGDAQWWNQMTEASVSDEFFRRRRRQSRTWRRVFRQDCFRCSAQSERGHDIYLCVQI